jgi:hypothetical protein
MRIGWRIWKTGCRASRRSSGRKVGFVWVVFCFDSLSRWSEGCLVVVVFAEATGEQLLRAGQHVDVFFDEHLLALYGGRGRSAGVPTI